MIRKENIVEVKKVYFFYWSLSFNVVTTDTKCTVPNSTANTDYQEIQEWAKIEGNNIIDPGA